MNTRGPASETTRRTALTAFWLAAVVPLSLCAGRLGNELWTDEVYTLTTFAARPVAEIASDYSAPNNHVLYSILLHGWLWVTQGLAPTEFVLRLPGLALAALALAGTFTLGLRQRNLSTAVAAALWLGLTQMFLSHALQLRGYGLSMALAAWLAVGAAETAPASWPRRVGITLCGAAALYTLPTNVLWLAPVTLLVLGRMFVRRLDWRRLTLEAAPWLAAWLLAALLYLPIYGQVLAAGDGAVGNRWSGAWALAGSFFSPALADAWWLALAAAIGLPLVLWQPSERGGKFLLLLSAGVIGGALALTGALGIRPFVRNLCPLLPLLAAGLGAALAALVEALVDAVARRRGSAGRPAVSAALAAVVIAAVMLPRVLSYPARLEAFRQRQFAQDGYYNYYDANFHPARLAAAVRDAVAAREGYLLMLADEDHYTLSYYLFQYGVEKRRGPPAEGPPGVRLYAALAPQTSVEQLLTQWQLPGELAAEMSVVADVGYYRLVRWPRLWPLANWQPAAENRPPAPSQAAPPF